MGGVFSKPKAKVVKPPPPPPLPAPVATQEVATQAGEAAVKRARRRSGFQKTILTGALAPKTGKKTTLG